MTVAELLQTLRERAAVLYVEDGRLKYTGPKRAPDDPIRAAIQEHRAELIAMFAPPRPAGWSDRLGRETLEPVPGHPGQWQETEASAALCTRCSEPLAEGDLLSCVEHQQTVGVTARPSRIPVAVTPGLSIAGLSVTPGASAGAVAVIRGPVLSRDDLLAIAELHGWERLPFKPGHYAGGAEEMWRAFADAARGETLRLVLTAVWERWGGTVEQYSQMAVSAAPQRLEAFVPSSEWQDLPDGYPCPPGVEWRTNLATGTSQVRWPEMAAVAGGSDE